MWCLWKSRNDNRFCRKSRSPLQVFAAGEAILKETSLEVTTPPLINGAMVSTETNKAVLAKDHAENQNQFTLQATPTPGKTIMDISNLSGPIVYSDVAWSLGSEGGPAVAGLGIFIQFPGDRQCKHLCISAISPPATSAIQAEAFGIMLATKMAEMLQLQQITLLTDNATLASTLAANRLILAPGHWTIRPQLAYITTSSSFDATRIYHINRSYNFRAHHQARLALKIRNSLFRFSCLCSGNATCLNADLAALTSVLQCTIVYVLPPFQNKCVKFVKMWMYLDIFYV